MINLNTLGRTTNKKFLDIRVYTRDTSEKARMLYISSSWRRLVNANAEYSAELPNHTSKEVNAADIILYTVEYLKFIGCTDIERLLRDRLQNLEDV